MNCTHCNGQVVRNYEDTYCLQCGREFDSTGKELVPVVGSEKLKPGGSRLIQKLRQDKYRYKVIHRENWERRLK